MGAGLLKVLLTTLGVGLLLLLTWWWRQEPPVAVRTAVVESGVVEQLVVNTRAGTVKACLRSKLSLALGGLVTDIRVREGDHVEAGQLLIELWNQDLKAQVLRTQAMAQRAELDEERICIEARQAARDAVRLERVHRQNLASEDLVDSARSRADASAVACEAAEVTKKESLAMVAVQEALLEKTRLRAPFAGVVAEVSAELGEFSTPSPTGVQTPPLVDLLTNDCYYVMAPIDEVDAAQVKLGQSVRVTLDAWRGEIIEGRIRRIGNYVQDFERQARTVEIEVELDTMGQVIPLAGYSADVEIIVEQKGDSLRIPSEALLQDQAVLVLPADGEKLELRQVQTGLANWHFTEIIEGLVLGDRVVLSLGEVGVAVGRVAVAQ